MAAIRLTTGWNICVLARTMTDGDGGGGEVAMSLLAWFHAGDVIHLMRR